VVVVTEWSSPDIDAPLLDVEVDDSINKQDKAATVVLDDVDGTTLDDYPKGTTIELQVTADTVTDHRRFAGFVAGNSRSDGQLTLEFNAFDFWLYQTFTRTVDNQSISAVLRALITEYTPITWGSGQVTIVNNRTVSREWSGITVAEAVAELAQLSGGEQFGVTQDNVFFFEPERAETAPRDFTDGEYLDHNADENHREEVNRVVVYYGRGENRSQVVAEDQTSQQTYGSNMGVGGGVQTVLSKYYPEISDEDIARERAQALRDRNESLRAIELETWGAHEVRPNQETTVEIPEADIAGDYVVASISYDWFGTTQIRLVENDEGILDFIKRSREETTRIDHKNAGAATGEPTEDESAFLPEGVNTPAVLEAQDMSAGDERTFREFVRQGQRFELLSVGVSTDGLEPVTDLTARVDDENAGSTLFATEAKREDGRPLAQRTGPVDLQFALENATGNSQSGVSARWVYRIADLFDPSTWMFQVGPRNLGTKRVTEAFDSTPGESWSVSPSGAVQSSAYVAPDTVYVGTDDGDVRALATSDGSQEWSFDTGSPVRSSPAVHNGTLYVGSDDGNVYALDVEDGSERWRYSTGGNVRSSPAIANGTVYVGSDDNTVYALDPADGSEVWTYSTAGQVRSSPAAIDGTVYIGSDDATVYALDAGDGSEVWTYGATAAVTHPPTVASDLVVVGAGPVVAALDPADGTEVWTFVLGTDVGGAVAIVDGTVYVPAQSGGEPGGLYAVAAGSGQLEWDHRDSGGVSAAPAVLGGQVVAAWSDGTVRGHDVGDGSELWSYDTGAGSVPTSPAVRDGTVYVGTT